MHHSLQGHEFVTFHLLTLVEAFDPWVKANREVCGLDKSPAEIVIAVFVFPWPLTLPLLSR
jgi:hypothetical protein